MDLCPDPKLPIVGAEAPAEDLGPDLIVGAAAPSEDGGPDLLLIGIDQEIQFHENFGTFEFWKLPEEDLVETPKNLRRNLLDQLLISRNFEIIQP